MKLKTYCLACREHTGNIGSRKVTMTNKVIRDKSRCSQCFSDKSRFMKQTPPPLPQKERKKKVVSSIIKQT